MTRSRRPSVQECSKRFDASCFFCDRTRYEGLQCHRIVPGSEGGKYRPWNVLTLCGFCHALVTAGVIRVHRAYPAMHALRVIHWTDADGVDHWSAWPKKKES